MAQETLSPDAIVTQTGTTGTVSEIQDDPDSPDASWLDWDGATNTSKLVVSFPTPTGSPTAGSTLQEFRVLVRKDASGGGTPQFSAALRETGSTNNIVALSTLTAVTNLTGVVFSLRWGSSNLATADGSATQLYIMGDSGGGGPNERGIDIGAIEWNVEYTAASTGGGGMTHPTIGREHSTIFGGLVVR